MPAVPADLCIEARWIVPLCARGRVLENHALVVRDGRILDVLPSADALDRYAATVVTRRAAHLLMPGMINAHTQAASSLFRGLSAPPPASLERNFVGPEFVYDGALCAIAEMLISGITCFGDRYRHPGAAAKAAAESGMRAVIGLPVSETGSPAEGLSVRDEYSAHPSISTVFAPGAPDTMSDAAFARLATLADELDAGIVIDVNSSADAIARCVAQHGMRPIERLWRLGLLTPALNAVYMTHATPADIELAQRTGISISLGATSSLNLGHQMPPVAALFASGMRLGLGTGVGPCSSQNVWAEMKLIALTAADFAWDALTLATRGGAAVLGLDADVGTLEPGKWADLCCVDMRGPAVQPLSDPVTQLVFCGGRDMVSDVWVAGRHLLADRELTRLDWASVAARAYLWAARIAESESHA
jgi:5-methylthioadenosine/S-adenosylhomocysteine deaminase